MNKCNSMFRKEDRSRSFSWNKKLVIISGILITLLYSIVVNTTYAQYEPGTATPRVIAGDEWQYFKGVEKPPRDWNQNDFDSSLWLKGLTGIGYGPGINRTYLADMKGKYLTLYARRAFTVTNIDKVDGLIFSIVCDGPFIAYLNGIEIIRTKTVQIPASELPPGTPQAEEFDLSGIAHELSPGRNVFAVTCSNDDIDSEQFSFVPAFEVLEKEGGRQ